MCPSDDAFLSAPLLVSLSGQGGLPLKLDITLTASDEVMQLRQQVSDLASQVETLQAQLHRAEYLFRCETIINQKLVDHCKAHRVPVPKALFERPF